MQVILDSSFARPGLAPIWGGKKGEFRDWTMSYDFAFIASDASSNLSSTLERHGPAAVGFPNSLTGVIFSTCLLNGFLDGGTWRDSPGGLR